MSRNYAGLSRERIILESLHIIAGRGLGGLSMRRLGDALEVEAMAIYHHFPLGKEQLFNAIAAYVTSPGSTGGTPLDAAADEDGEDGEDAAKDAEEADNRPWDQRLASWADDYRARLLEYSGALSLLVHRAPATPADADARALVHRAFTDAGVPEAELDRAADALYSYCLGAVVHQVRHQDDEDAPDAEEAAARFHHGLRALLRGLAP
ncbi:MULTISPECIES: TetR/AcrR family transcriptional regulator [unclassified Nocardiopsis]|uniref:TetR/AcrR family transcriptional regulator n=1 Tax=Nocardiopsis TaxID=2013 RepID=UPI00387AF87C